jgi:outer membrane assembly lipoprotein YfiO
LIRPFVRCVLPLAFLLLVWGCGQKGARLQKSVVPPDKTLFETGDEYLRKSQFIKARLAFQTLINTYPDSDMSADAYLAIGDSFYDEGGTENLLQAEDQYKNFIIFFPMNPKAADAQMKVVSLNMKMMRAPDRDQQYSVKAAQQIQKMLDQFPDSDYIPIAKQYLAEVHENLAQGDYGVGMFYFDKGNYFGSQSRLKEIVDKYPTFSGMDDAMFRLAQSYEQLNNKDEAATYYAKIAQGFPFSKHFEEAKSQLQAMGKAIPAVDTQLAAVNQGHLKPSTGFSPLKPFIDFASALGFKGPPDRYEAAKRSVEAKRAEGVMAQSGKPAEGEKAADDILINTTLSKDSTGKTQVSTVLGGNATANQANADKNVDKKKEADKKKKNAKKPQ